VAGSRSRTLVDDRPLSIPALAGLASIPAMWTATMKLEQLEGLALRVTPLGGTTRELSIGEPVTVDRANCSIGEAPFGLLVQGAPGHYVLYVEPTLTPAGC
jgi:hypothetical protein